MELWFASRFRYFNSLLGKKLSGPRADPDRMTGKKKDLDPGRPAVSLLTVLTFVSLLTVLT
jgi:hypothetical protein